MHCRPSWPQIQSLSLPSELWYWRCVSPLSGISSFLKTNLLQYVLCADNSIPSFDLSLHACYNARNIIDQLCSLEIEEEVSQLGTQGTLTKYVTSGPWGITKKTTIIEHPIFSLRFQKSLLSQCGQCRSLLVPPKGLRRKLKILWGPGK